MTPDDAIARVLAARSRLLGVGAQSPPPLLSHGDHELNPAFPPGGGRTDFREAAVLIAITEDVRLILTERTAALKSHSGEVSLPGGKVDAGDASPEAAAIREAHEEIGLDPARVHVVGRLKPYMTHHGYRIHPVVAFIEDGAALVPNPQEVAQIFEVELAEVVNRDSFVLQSRPFNGHERYFWTLPHPSQMIWGITAGILQAFATEVDG